MNRRVFISAGLALAALVRRAWAQSENPSSEIRYASLTHLVRIPVNAVDVPWQPVAFVAEGTTPSVGPASVAAGRRVLISGVLFRTDTALSALCVTCPHEQCQVELVTEDDRLARMIGQKSENPLFECGCHSSVFDAAREGARISGETPRGLYRFRIAGVRDSIVEIGEIEEVALSEV